MLNKILDKHRIDIREIDDSPAPCAVCSCVLQWRPFQYVPWCCYDCERPQNDAVTRFARILADKPGGGAEWRTVRPRRQEVVIDADFDFDSLPEPMTGRTRDGYRCWMYRINSQKH